MLSAPCCSLLAAGHAVPAAVPGDSANMLPPLRFLFPLCCFVLPEISAQPGSGRIQGKLQFGVRRFISCFSLAVAIIIRKATS